MVIRRDPVEASITIEKRFRESMEVLAMGNAPDNIWAKPSRDGWLHGVCSDVLCDNDGAEYLLSTPARENADELMEALEYAHTALGYASEVLNITNTRNCVLVGARDIAALLSKIKEESNE